MHYFFRDIKKMTIVIIFLATGRPTSKNGGVKSKRRLIHASRYEEKKKEAEIELPKSAIWKMKSLLGEFVQGCQKTNHF